MVRLGRVVHDIGVANGSDAIHIVLQVTGVDDEVIMTAFTFFATAGAIASANTKPVYVDINPVTFNKEILQKENVYVWHSRGNYKGE